MTVLDGHYILALDGTGYFSSEEVILREDGDTKNDCERNAAGRCIEILRGDHPHIKLIVTEDALSPNAPHIETLKRLTKATAVRYE